MDRFNWRQITIPVIYFVLVAMMVVFAHAGFQGNYGLSELHEARAQEQQLKEELAALRRERAQLVNKVDRLGDHEIDLDLLDERARAVLGLARPDEIIIR